MAATPRDATCPGCGASVGPVTTLAFCPTTDSDCRVQTFSPPPADPDDTDHDHD